MSLCKYSVSQLLDRVNLGNDNSAVAKHWILSSFYSFSALKVFFFPDWSFAMKRAFFYMKKRLWLCLFYRDKRESTLEHFKYKGHFYMGLSATADPNDVTVVKRCLHRFMYVLYTVVRPICAYVEKRHRLSKFRFPRYFGPIFEIFWSIFCQYCAQKWWENGCPVRKKRSPDMSILKQ